MRSLWKSAKSILRNLYKGSDDVQKEEIILYEYPCVKLPLEMQASTLLKW